MSSRSVHPRTPLHVALPPESVGGNVLITPRLVLRPLAPSDQPEFVRALRAARTDLDEFCPIHRDGESDADAFQRHLAMSSAALVTRKAVRLVITPARDSAHVLGAVNLNTIVRGLEGRATANWWLIPTARWHGFAREAVQSIVDFALADAPHGLGLQRVDALIDPANFPSLRLAERLTMRAQPGSHHCVTIRGQAKVHQMYSAFASLPPLPSSIIEFKPLPGLDAILRHAVRRA